MNLDKINVHEKLVPSNYLKLARDAQVNKEVAIRELIEKRKLPIQGWSDEVIESVVRHLSTLDSNNFGHKAGLGEREARIACSLVAKRHYNFGHGIGRSGDLLEPQPKAAGSTLLSNLTNVLLLQLIHEMGVRSCRACFLLPMATGMSLTLCFLELRRQRPRAEFVIWSRIDQKSCFKSILTAGLKPIIIDPVMDAQGRLTTDVAAITQQIVALSHERLLCLFTTTSCFAPRSGDDVMAVAHLAQEHNLPHVINNAYGLQSTYIMHQIEEAQHWGRIDLFVQSTDKNLMVPVGGSIIAGFDEKVVFSVAKSYPGRASFSQTLDVFMTLLSLGRNGYLNLVRERKSNFEYLHEKLCEFAQARGETVLTMKQNPISLALTLVRLQQCTSNRTELTQFGSMMYTRGVSGVRVIVPGDYKVIEGYAFPHWGSHHNSTRIPYLTVAASLGVTKSEIDVFFQKLHDCWKTMLHKPNPNLNQAC